MDDSTTILLGTYQQIVLHMLKISRHGYNCYTFMVGDTYQQFRCINDYNGTRIIFLNADKFDEFETMKNIIVTRRHSRTLLFEFVFFKDTPTIPKGVALLHGKKSGMFGKIIINIRIDIHGKDRVDQNTTYTHEFTWTPIKDVAATIGNYFKRSMFFIGFEKNRNEDEAIPFAEDLCVADILTTAGEHNPMVFSTMELPSEDHLLI